MTFETGQLYMTRGIKAQIEESSDFGKFILICMRKYAQGDWGELPDEDKKLNDEAVQFGGDRIVAHYENPMGDVYIITEEDRSVTTILFTYEY